MLLSLSLSLLWTQSKGLRVLFLRDKVAFRLANIAKGNVFERKLFEIPVNFNKKGILCV